MLLLGPNSNGVQTVLGHFVYYPRRILFGKVPKKILAGQIGGGTRITWGPGYGHSFRSHGQAVLITDAAVFYSRLTKWDDRFAGLPPHTISHYCYYRIAFEETLPLGTNEFVMDISDALARKLDSIRCYKTQFPPAKGYVFDRVDAIARCAGGLAGFHAGEIFCSPKAIGTRDLVQFWDRP